MSEGDVSEQTGSFSGANLDNRGNNTPPTSIAQTLQMHDEKTVYAPTSTLMSQARGALYSYVPQTLNNYQIPPQQNQYMPNGIHENETVDVNTDQWRSHAVAQEFTQGQSITTASYSSNSNVIMNNMSTNMNMNNNMTTGNEGAPSEAVHTGVPENTAAWVAQMMQGLDIRLRQIDTHLIAQNAKWYNMGLSIQSQSDRMARIEHNIAEFNGVKSKVATLENTVKAIDNGVKRISDQVNIHQSKIQTQSEICEDARTASAYSKVRVDDISAQVQQVLIDNDDLRRDNETMRSQLEKADRAIVDLQCRSMRDNLLFVGIHEPEYVENDPEDVEKTLDSFLAQEMNITDKIPFHRVHRMGTYESDDSPRPIVAKFERFKDRELVRRAAPQTLRGKPFGVREQFPKVIEDRRKQLYPIMKKARSNQDNKVRLVRDKLFINSCEYVPDSDEIEQTAAKSQSYHRKAKPQYVQNRSRDHQLPAFKSRVFQRSKYERYEQPNNKLNFQSPMASNRQSNPNSGMERSISRKNKASSPLDPETTKRYRDNEGSEASDHDTGSVDTYLPSKSPETDTRNRTYPQDKQQTCVLETPNMDSVQLDNGPLIKNNPRDQSTERSADEA